MRDMTKKEIFDFIMRWTWGTLIGVEENRPYAIEVSYGTDGKYIYCGSRPGGRMAQCISGNSNIAFKICDSDRQCARWRAVIVEGTAERVTDFDDILHAVRMIARQMGLRETAFDRIADTVAADPRGNSIRIPIQTVSGVTTG